MAHRQATDEELRGALGPHVRTLIEAAVAVGRTPQEAVELVAELVEEFRALAAEADPGTTGA